MLIIISFPIFLIIFLLIYNYILYMIILLKKLNNMSLEITLLSSFSILIYLYFVIFCVHRNVIRLGYNIDLIKLVDFFKKNIINAFVHLNGFDFYIKVYVALLLTFFVILFVIMFFANVIIISKYIRISFKRIHYLLMNNEIYKKYIVLTEIIYGRIQLIKINYVFNTQILTLIFKVFFLLPIVILLLSIIYDCIYNEYILEKCFYVCCVFPIYYLIINTVSFLTENSLQRADDMVVYAAIYGKDSEYIQQDFLEELDKYKYETSISDVFGAQDLKTRHQHTFTNEEYRAIQKYKEIEKTLLNFF